MKKLLISIFLLLCFSARGQQESYEIVIKQYHEGTVTDIIINEEKNELISSDSNGVILIHDATKYKFKSTLPVSINSPIKNIRLINTNELAIFYGQEKKFLVIYNLETKRIKQRIENVWLTNISSEKYLAIGRKDEKQHHFLDLYSKASFKIIHTVPLKYEALSASISKDEKHVYVIEMEAPPKYYNGETSVITNFKIYNILSKKNIFEDRFPITKNDYIPTAVLDEEDSILLVLTAYEMSQPLFGLPCGIQFFRYPKDTLEKEKVFNGLFCSRMADTKLTTLSGENILLFGDRNRDEWLELQLQNGKYQIHLNDDSLKNNIDVGIYNPSAKEYAFLNYKRIDVYDKSKQRLEKNIDQVSYEGNEAYFVNGNDWLITQNNKIIKYFNTGNLANQLDFESIKSSFLKDSKKITPIKDLNFKDGIFGFYSNNIKWNANKTSFKQDYSTSDYYVYDIKKKETKKVFSHNNTSKLDRFNLDYSAIKNAFLMGEQISDKVIIQNNSKFNVGQVSVHSQGGKFIIKDSIRYSQEINKENFKFSNSGKFIFIYDNKGTLSIYDWKNRKSVFNTKSGTVYKIVPVGDDDLIINTSCFENDTEAEGQHFHNYHIVHHKDGYDRLKKNNGFIKHADYANNTLVKIIDESVFINNFELKLHKEEPTKVSLNSDATKLFISHYNGKINLYDVVSKKWINTILSFNTKEHLIYNKNYYYTNKDDLNNFLYLKKDHEFFAANVHGLDLYNPAAVLSGFGTIDDDYKAVLDKATAIRFKTNKVLYNNQLIIEDFYLAKKANTYETYSLKNKINIEMANPSNDTISFEIRVNNVAQKNVKFTKEDKKNYSVHINLNQSVNQIEIIATKKEISSFPIRKKIKYKGRLPNKDLYVLTVGVSDYQQSKNNLSYAHKDALDVAFRYGNFSSGKREWYLNQTLPYHIIHNKDTLKTSVLEGFSFLNNTYNPPKQLSKDGSKWLAFVENKNSDGTKELKLWDFNSKSIKTIQLKQTLFLDYYDYKFITKNDDSGMYFKSYYYSNSEVLLESNFYYDFHTETLSEVKIPFDIHTAFQINHNNWLYFDQGNSREDFKYSEDENQTTEKAPSISIFSKKNEKWDEKKYTIDLQQKTSLKMLKVHPNGKMILVEVKNNDLEETQIALYKLKKNTYKLHKIVQDNSILRYEDNIDSWFFDKKNKTLNALKLHEEENYTLFSLNFNSGKITQKSTNIDSFQEMQHIGLENGNPLVIKASEQASKYNLNEDSYGDLQKMLDHQTLQPISFRNTYVNYIINKDATSTHIKQQIKTFFKNAKPQDQIILFLAGHGVLSKDLDYFYATHDIDFYNPEIKGISFNSITELLNESSAIHKLLIMDTCHAGNTLDLDDYQYTSDEYIEGHRGSIAKSSSTSADDLKVSTIVDTIFDNFLSKTGITVLSASSGENVAYEYEGLNNGAFTASFLNILNSRIDPISYRYTPEKYKLNNNFISILENTLLNFTSKKQKLDVREINQLVKLKLW